MSKEIAPAFQFYVKDWLSDPNVASLSFEQEGWYIHLVCHCWMDGSIPSDPAMALRLLGIRERDLCRCEESDIIDRLNARHQDMQELLDLCFVQHEAELGKLIHPRIEKERQGQEQRRKERSESGKRGGKTSAIKRLKNPSSAWKQVQANSSSSSSSSFNNNNSLSIKVRGSRMVPKEFEISNSLKEWAVKERPDLDLSVEIEKFRDYEFSRTYTKWESVFRNWIRNAKGGIRAVERKPTQPGLMVGKSTVQDQPLNPEYADALRKRAAADPFIDIGD